MTHVVHTSLAPASTASFSSGINCYTWIAVGAIRQTHAWSSISNCLLTIDSFQGMPSPVITVLDYSPPPTVFESPLNTP